MSDEHDKSFYNRRYNSKYIYREQLLHINKYYVSNVHEGGKPATMPWPVNSPYSPDRRTCVFTT